MGRQNFVSVIRNAWVMVDGARGAAAAVKARRAPDVESLRKLGIDPKEATRLTF